MVSHAHPLVELLAGLDVDPLLAVLPPSGVLLATQTPLLQVPSRHAVPLALGVWTHCPCALQVEGSSHRPAGAHSDATQRVQPGKAKWLAEHASQWTPAKALSQVQDPSAFALPLPLHVVGPENWQASPVYPVQQMQVPSAWAVPCALHWVASEYWQLEPE